MLTSVYALSFARQKRLAIITTAIASFAFYAVFSLGMLPLLIASVLTNFAIGTLIIDSKSDLRRRLLLTAGLAFDLGVLFVYKYTGFAVSVAAQATGLPLPIPEIVLPIGISFYTFTQIAYLIDCARGHAHRYRLWDYALFVSFFPHLVAGPILRHAPLIAQLEDGQIGAPSARRAWAGLIFFGVGLAKKVLVADTLSPMVAATFDNATALSFGEAWLGALLYTFQLYYDFSGYSEMAVGLALLLNLRIPINFNSPYKALSIIDFWRRWHISLSHFLRNYLYISLGGNRVGKARHYLNLFLTMLLGGIWHGAGWTFVVWGALHGAYLVVAHACRRILLPKPMAWLITFLAVIVGWVFFRAASLDDAVAMLHAMSGASGFALQTPHLENSLVAIGAVVALTCWAVWAPNTQQLAIRRTPSLWLSLLVGLAVAACLARLSSPSEFLYFQF